MPFSFLPSRRVADVTVQEVGDETLVYDERSHKAFCLNLISGTVWRFADGEHTLSEISEMASSKLQHPVTEEVVRFALKELQKDGLLQEDGFVEGADALSRRSMMKHLGLSAAVMVPLVTAVFAPRPAHAESCRPPHW